jgi:CubicO group peptidase (beta-lactamase class C family)
MFGDEEEHMHRHYHGRAWAALAISFALTASSAATGPTVSGPLGDRLDTYLTRLADLGFSGAVIVVKDGQVVLEKAYGLADRATGRPLTIETPLLVGSITKQFTAAAIMKLEMAGKLRTTDTIDKYFPGAPDDKKSITLHQLLTHSAGLESDYGSGDAEQVSREEFLRRVFSRPLRTPPGAAYHYSNAGFSLLGMVVESLSGQTWEDFLHDQLFVPAGMRHTGAKLSRFQVADLPHGYANGEDRGTFTQDYGPDGPHWNQRANGGVLSTVGDMYRWHLALQGEKILSADAKKKMFTPYVREGPDADTFYGYGWVVGKTPRGTTLIEHNGGNGVFGADFKRFVDEGVVIYMASNNAEMFAWQVSPIVTRITFGGDVALPPAVATVPVAQLEQYVGTYTIGSGDRLIVTVSGGQLLANVEGQDAVELIQPEAKVRRTAFDALNRRVEEIVTQGWKGNDEPFQKALDIHPSLAQLSEQRQTARAEDVNRLGAFKTVVVLGTLAGPEDRAFTVARIEFARGVVYERYVWEEGQLVRVRRIDAPGGTPLYPTPDGGLVSYSIQARSEARLNVERGGDGRPKALVTTGTPAVRAVRGN